MFKHTHVLKMQCFTCFAFSTHCFAKQYHQYLTNAYSWALAIALRSTGPISYQCNFTIQCWDTPYTQNIPKQLYKWIHLLALPPLRQQQCSKSSNVKPHAPIGFSWLPWSRQPRYIFPLPFQIHPNQDKYLATSGGCGRAAKPLRPFGRAEIEVPQPPLRCAAALGPNPKCVQGVNARPQDLHSRLFSMMFLDFAWHPTLFVSCSMMFHHSGVFYIQQVADAQVIPSEVWKHAVPVPHNHQYSTVKGSHPIFSHCAFAVRNCLLHLAKYPRPPSKAAAREFQLRELCAVILAPDPDEYRNGKGWW